MIGWIIFTLWLIGATINWTVAVMLFCDEYRPKHKWFYWILTALVVCSFVTWLVVIALVLLDRERNDSNK